MGSAAGLQGRAGCFFPPTPVQKEVVLAHWRLLAGIISSLQLSQGLKSITGPVKCRGQGGEMSPGRSAMSRCQAQG